MPTNNHEHMLPRMLEKLLASLSVYFARKNQSQLQAVLVNSRCRVQEETDYDNWNGGQWGHTLTLEVPPELYYDMFDELAEASQSIKEVLNKLNTIDDEWIADVRLELADDPSISKWREESGLLLSQGPLSTPASEEDLQRLWEPGLLRVFLSHKSEYKRETAELKRRLRKFGVTCFVAHEDIEPSKAWQDEIERALFSMHAIIPLLTDGFHNSNWTDQEIGIAVGRGVPVFAVRLGADPYGFIGKYQAIQGASKTSLTLAKELHELLLDHRATKMHSQEALVNAFCASESYDQANTLIEMLSKNLTSPNAEWAGRLREAHEKNSQVRDAFKVKSQLPGVLKRLSTGKQN